MTNPRSIYVVSSKMGSSPSSVLGFCRSEEFAKKYARDRVNAFCAEIKLKNPTFDVKTCERDLEDGYEFSVSSISKGWLYDGSEVVEGTFTIARVSKINP